MNKVFTALVTGLYIALICGCQKSEMADFVNMNKLAVFEKIELLNNEPDSLEVMATLETNGHDAPEISGFCWSLINNMPNISDKVVEVKPEGNILKAKFKWTVNVDIYVRAYYKNSVGITYSDPIQVPWTGNASNLPELITGDIYNVTYGGFTVEGLLSSNGGLPLIEKGFCFSSSNTIPGYSDGRITADGIQFTAKTSGLSDSTLYYVRAFARNVQGISYGQVKTVVTRNVYQLGETGPAGGIIFYVREGGGGDWNFLEAAPSDISVLHKWAPDNQPVNQTQTALGAGLSNSNIILNEYGTSSSYAAQAANSYVYGAYTDWFLPSRDELMQIRQNLFLNGTGNLTSNATYWTSSQDQVFTDNAWVVKMIQSNNGNTVSANKNTNFKVRAIRRF
jgi:hypothetical protein